LGNRTTLEATYYRNQISDLIYRKTDLAADPTGAVRLNVNAGEGTTNGVELGARHQLSRWLQMRASYSYTAAIISQNPFAPEIVGKRIPFIPEHTAAASLLGSWRRLTGSLSARYAGATYSTDANTDTTRGVFGAYDPFFVVDASFGVDIGRGVTIFTNADNLLNRRYYQFFLSPGRAANIGLRWRM
jgi:iron complex outermembrane receptor protein